MEEEIILVDRELRILYANASFLRRAGKNLQEAIGKKCFDFVHSESCDPHTHPCPAHEVFEKGESYKTLHTHTGKDGNPIFVEILASPIREGEQITSVVEVMRDVTEKTIAQRRLQEFIDASPDAIFSSDAEGRLLSVNPTYVRMFGYTNASQLLGKPAAETVWADSHEREKFISELDEKGAVRDREALLKKADGSFFYGSISSVSKKDVKGKTIGLEGTLRDITKRKMAEEELKRRNDELAVIAGITSLLNQSEKIEPLLERCMEQTCVGMGMDAGWILLFSETGEVTQKIFYGVSLNFVGTLEKEGYTLLLEDSSLEKQIIFIGNIGTDERVKKKDILRGDALVSLVSSPLQTGSKLVGLLFLASKKEREWGEDNIRLLSSVANFMGAGIQRISYLNQIKSISARLERIVEEKSLKTKALLEASYALQHTTNWQLGLKTIVERITSGFGFDNTYVFLMNDRKKVLQCEAYLSSYADLSNVEIPLDDDGYVSVQCMRQKKPINIKNAFEDPRVKKQAGYHIEAFAWVPIIFQDEVLGAFTVDNKDSKKPITDEDIETLVLFANAAASFIEKTRVLFLPATEEKMSGKMKYMLNPSEGYVVFEEKPEKAFEVFMEAVTHGMQGFCATRTYPSKLRQRYSLTKTPILWLSSAETPESISPTDLGKLVHIITEFLQRAEDPIVFIEGLEYLITENDFLKIMKMLHSLMDEINISGSRLLLSINPKTLIDKEMGVMKKEFTTI